MSALKSEAERAGVEALDLERFLTDRRSRILDDAAKTGRGAHLPHYEAEGSIERRLASLFDLLVDSISRRNLGAIVAYSQAVAGERFLAGFDLSEVQTAFNVLEEAIWRRVLQDLPPEAFARAISLVETVLGAGKDALARAYVSNATQAHVPSLDLGRLFEGTDDAWVGPGGLPGPARVER